MKTQFKLMRDGSPCYVAAWVKTLSADARNTMGRNSGDGGSIYSGREKLEHKAIAYATAMLTSEGVTVPTSGDVRAIVEFEILDNKERRARSVAWFNFRRVRYGNAAPDAELLRYDIPHWDHVPTVTEYSERCTNVSFAIAAE